MSDTTVFSIGELGRVTVVGGSPEPVATLALAEERAGKGLTPHHFYRLSLPEVVALSLVLRDAAALLNRSETH